MATKKPFTDFVMNLARITFVLATKFPQSAAMHLSGRIHQYSSGLPIEMFLSVKYVDVEGL